MFQRLGLRLLAGFIVLSILVAVPACMGPQRRGGEKQEGKGDKGDKGDKEKKGGDKQKGGGEDQEGGDKEKEEK